MTISRNKVRHFMFLELQDLNHPDLWDDGAVNCTRLAENAAHEFNHDEWLDDDSHWVWDLASDIASQAEERLDALAARR